MNYKKAYENLISKASLRAPLIGTGIEKHHILPRSMGGSNEDNNIVALSYREHYLAHRLLYKIYRNKEMAFAWRAMHLRTRGRETVKFSSRDYEKAKYAWKIHMQEILIGRKLSDESKRKMREAKLGSTPWNKGMAMGKQTSKQEVKYYQNPKNCILCEDEIPYKKKKNKYCTIACRDKDRKTWITKNNNAKPNSGSFKKGRKVDSLVADKIAKKLTGLKRQRGVCNICGKEGAISLLKRWHFDNCKGAQL